MTFSHLSYETDGKATKIEKKKNKIKKKPCIKNRLYLKPMLAFPLPMGTSTNSLVIIIRVVCNIAVMFGVAYDESSNGISPILREYDFGLFMYIFTLSCFVVSLCLIRTFEFENDCTTQMLSFENLFNHKAFFEIIECLEYGTLKWV